MKKIISRILVWIILLAVIAGIITAFSMVKKTADNILESTTVTAANETTTETATTSIDTTDGIAQITPKQNENPIQNPTKKSGTITTTKKAAASSGVSAIENEVVTLVNEIRRSNGLSELKLNQKLSSVARTKSQDMRNKGYFSHTSPTYGTPFEMITEFGISYRTAGENIAKGYSSAKAVVDGWMNSEGHRANILNSSFTEIGVGYVADGNYWTQMFIG